LGALHPVPLKEALPPFFLGSLARSQIPQGFFPSVIHFLERFTRQPFAPWRICPQWKQKSGSCSYLNSTQKDLSSSSRVPPFSNGWVRFKVTRRRRLQPHAAPSFATSTSSNFPKDSPILIPIVLDIHSSGISWTWIQHGE
jgi:hypothetical protein